MAGVLTKSRQWRPTLSFTRIAEDRLRLFCTAIEDPAPKPKPKPNPKPERRTRATIDRNPESIENTICRMMANRSWTTRLQNSIRSLVPRFDNSLVWNVLNVCRDSEHALQFYRWVERSGLVRHDRDSHLKIIKILTGDAKLNHARLILLDMPKKGVPWDEALFVKLMEGYAKAGIVQESVNVFNMMKKLRVVRTGKSYDALLLIILRRGRYMMAKRYFNAMLRDGVEPTLVTYNIMIWGFFLSKRLETARRFFEEMKQRDVSPDAVTYNTMMHGYNRLKMTDEAEKCFAEMKERKIGQTAISYTAMIKGYLDAERFEDALRLFAEMKKSKINPNEVTFSTLLPRLCDAGKMVEARALLREMVERRVVPKDKSVFSKLLSGHCKSGDLDAAAEVLETMNSQRVPTNCGHYGVLIQSFCEAGLHGRAAKLVDELVEKEIVLQPRRSGSAAMEASVYNPVIEHLCLNGETGKAENFFRQLMKTGVKDSAAFNSLVRGHSKEGNPESALEVFRIMERRGVETDSESFSLLVKSYLAKGEPAEAKSALDSMIESGHRPESSLFRSVAESLFEDGRVQTASRVMRTMVEKGLVTGNADLFSKIIEALFLRGHCEEAIGRVNLLMTQKKGSAPDLDALLSVLSEKKKTIAALKLVEFCMGRDWDLDFSTYDKVLDALLAAGKTLKAYSVLTALIAKGGSTKWSKSGDLINSLNKEGNSRQSDILSRLIEGSKKDGKKSTKRGSKKQESASAPN